MQATLENTNYFSHQNLTSHMQNRKFNRNSLVECKNFLEKLIKNTLSLPFPNYVILLMNKTAFRGVNFRSINANHVFNCKFIQPSKKISIFKELYDTSLKVFRRSLSAYIIYYMKQLLLSKLY